MHRLSERRVPSRVSCSTRSTAARAPGTRRVRSPSTCTRTPCSRSSSTSRAMYSSSRSIRAEISVGGRCQFSSENANSVSTSTPASIAPSTTSRTAFMPARCPRGRGRCRSSAQRPLPSMMMATWRGTAPPSRICARRSSPMSDLHDLRLFGFDQLFHELHMVVVELLRVFLGVLLVVLGDVLGLLDPVDRFGAGAAHADAPFLGELALHRLHRLVHRLLRLLEVIRERGHRTIVPTRSPASTLAVAPGWLMLNTTIGSRFSLHSPNAFASITAYPFTRASWKDSSGMNRAFGCLLGSAV